MGIQTRNMLLFFIFLLPISAFPQDCVAKLTASEAALKKGETVLSYLEFREGRAWVYKGSKFAVIDMNGKLYTDFIFSNPEPFHSGGFAIAEKGYSLHQYYLIDTMGHISEGYDYFIPTNNDWYKVQKDNKYTFLDKQGKQVPGWEWYDEIGSFSEGLTFVRKDREWAVVNKNGKALFMLPTDIEEAYPFSEGLAAIKKGDRWGIVDRTGKIIIPQFEEILGFYKGKDELMTVSLSLEI